MGIEQDFPLWGKLTAEEQEQLKTAATMRHAQKGELLHQGLSQCTGLIVVHEGQLRAFIQSEEGKEMTLYRLFQGDICLFSAACMMRSIQFEVMVEAEQDTDFWLIPTEFYKNWMERSTVVANYTNEVMASRFSEVMWLMEQVMWKSFDQRLAAFLLEESAVENDTVLKITHDKIAAHLGTAREVVTRMLRYFQSEGLVKLSRGTVELTEPKKLRKLAGE